MVAGSFICIWTDERRTNYPFWAIEVAKQLAQEFAQEASAENAVYP